MGPNLTPAARSLLSRQRGVLASWQAPGVGMSPRALTHAGRTGWQRLTSRTFLDVSSTPTMAQLRMAGLLESGPDGALTGCSALVEAGWKGDDAGWVDVVVARDHRSRRVEQPAWLRLHSTTDVPSSWGAPARVRAARAAVDAAAWARTPRERMFILTTSAQQRLTTVDQMRDELTARRVSGATQMREVLDAIELGATSANEMDFLRACRAYVLPTPRMQVRRVAGSRRCRIDAQFLTRSRRTVMVEIDGVGHFDIDQWQDDLIRQNELVVTERDAILLRITGWQVRHEPETFFPLLARYLEE